MTIEDIALCVGTGCIYIGTSAFFLIISAFFTENVCEILAAVIAKFLEWRKRKKKKEEKSVGKPRMIGQFKPFKANRRYNWRWQKKQERKKPLWQKTTTKPA